MDETLQRGRLPQVSSHETRNISRQRLRPQNRREGTPETAQGRQVTWRLWGQASLGGCGVRAPGGGLGAVPRPGVRVW